PFATGLPLHPPRPLFPYTTLFRSPLAWASRVTISATCTSPALPIGISTDRAACACAEPESPRRMIHAHFPVAPCMTNRSPSRCRSEEHTSELQSRVDLVCRPLLEK